MEQHEHTAADRAGQMLRAHRRSSERRRLVATLVVLVLVAAAVVVGGYLVATSSGDDDGDSGTAVPRHSTGDTYGFKFTPAIATGTEVADPPVTLEVFEDFLCPSCRLFEERNGGYLRDQVAAGRISVVYHPFTFLVGRSTNEYTERAANAAACVADTAGVAAYVAFHGLLYAQQPAEGGPGHTDDTLIAFAEQSGAPDADTCIRERTFAAWVTEAFEHGRTLGVSVTPTLILNGNVLKDAEGNISVPEPDQLEQAIVQVGG